MTTNYWSCFSLRIYFMYMLNEKILKLLISEPVKAKMFITFVIASVPNSVVPA